MKIERSFSEEYIYNDSNLKKTHTKSVGIDFGILAVVVLLAIIVYESFRSGFFLTVPIFVWYAIFFILIRFGIISIIITVITLVDWRNE